MKYAWITDQAKDYPVTILCHFMDVSRSCYYDWVSSPKTDREKENDNVAILNRTHNLKQLKDKKCDLK
ncbi:hypothetical protein [sulfur-oxidizing endosymbiont of Gigantopelta aegis]|uniref:hypothetical protein n=1 Tax=sulfur-oxidizing endosymbiont of Gigantopelta aegis TaxID=2794934 RepID=UPI0018DB343C|nr:hypothetical protein [sulfur-oxidizing endosymbiont of Gigantopelta aegis]